MRGLTNFGNTCYISSMLQCLHAIPAFKKVITADGVMGRSPLVAALGRVMRSMDADGDCDRPVPLGPLLNCLVKHLGDLNQQEDTQAFLLKFLDAISNDGMPPKNKKATRNSNNTADRKSVV